MGLKLIFNKMNRSGDLQGWFSLSISILSHSFSPRSRNLFFVSPINIHTDYIPGHNVLLSILGRQGIPIQEGSCGSRQRKQDVGKNDKNE